MLGSVTRWVLAHKRIVASFWVLVTVVGIASVGSSTQSFSKQFSVPGREGFVTNDRIARIFHNGGKQRTATRGRHPARGHAALLTGSARRSRSGRGEAAASDPR